MDVLPQIQYMVSHIGSRLRTEIKPVDVVHMPYAAARAKQCFSNAYKYVHDNHLDDAKLVYGYVIIAGVIPVEHMWVAMTRAGKTEYVDPTLKEGVYYSVYEASLKEVEAYVDAKGCVPDLRELNLAKA